ncbi:uncharacterized protein LOC132936457 isoform X4 [Metopolophium dirhodum]|uniref:uncharacterized protein LOC132936457 isoform X4 n=1 Tax=Metopolophium dirhodum TaxID=44670 RepID=UPI00298F6AB7|nr:uncharacterized protein LOC132936457 isoform X4 [Metopolophium dirhodum]
MSSINKDDAPKECLYLKVLAENERTSNVQFKIKKNMLLTKLMEAYCERTYASYVPNVVAWNCDPTIPVSYYWNNEESSHYLEKAALAEDGNTSKKYRSCQL